MKPFPTPVETNPIIQAMMFMSQKGINRNAQLIYIVMRFSSQAKQYGRYIFSTLNHRKATPYIETNVCTYTRSIKELINNNLIAVRYRVGNKGVYIVPVDNMIIDHDDVELFMKEHPEIYTDYMIVK